MVVYLRWCKDTAFFHRFQIFLKLFCCEIGCTNALFHRNMLFNIKNRVLTLLFAIRIANWALKLEYTKEETAIVNSHCRSCPNSAARH